MIQPTQEPQPDSGRQFHPIVFWLLGFGFVLGAIVLFRSIFPITPDYYYTYYPTGKAFLQGETLLYDANAPNYYNFPWGLLTFAPLTIFPFIWSQAIWNVGSMGCVFVSTHFFVRERPVSALVVVLAIVNLHTIALVLAGQIDAIIFAGVILGWWAIRNHNPWALSLAFAIMGIKPPNLTLTFLLYLIAIKDWERSDQIKAISLPIVLVVLSAFLIGFDWPLRYIEHYQNKPPNDYLAITLWRGARVVGLPGWPVAVAALVASIAFLRTAWREGLTNRTLGLALTTNLVFTIYANGSHYVLLIPVFIFVARRNWKLAVFAWLLTWTPLSRAYLGFDAAVLDIGYALVLYAAVWLYAPAAGTQSGTANEAMA